MAKVSHSYNILSEIELFLDVGKYDDARVLLAFLDDALFDRESRLRLFLIKVTLDGAAAYKGEIAELAALSDLTEMEKGIIEKIFSLERESTGENPRRNDSPADGGGLPPDRSGAFHSPVSQPVDERKLMKDHEAELAIFKETIRSLERQLSEKQDLLEDRKAEIKALRSQVTELITQLMESDQAKDQEVQRLREDLALRDDLLQAKETEIAELRVRFAKQIRGLEVQLGETKGLLATRDAKLGLFKTRMDGLIQEAERIHGLETQLGEARSLLAARDAELDSIKAGLSELVHERDQWISERILADRALRENLREQSGWVQIMESSIVEMEEHRDKQVRLLALQLGEKQKLLRSSRAELDDLRSQVCLLNQRLVDTEVAKLRAETALYEEHGSTSRTFSVARSSDDNPAGERTQDPEPIHRVSNAKRDVSFPWHKAWRRVSSMGWQTRTFPAATLTVVAVGLLVFPVGYFLLSNPPEKSNPDMPIRWERTFEPSGAVDSDLSIPVRKTLAEDEDRRPPGKTAPRLVEQKTQKTTLASNRNVKSDARPNRAADYITRRAVPLREQPRYAAKAKAQIDPGTPVMVLDTQGSWLRVQTSRSGAVGYVRKEYLVHVISP